MTERHHRTLVEMLSLPTAPFHEQAVAQYVRRWAAGVGVRVTSDGGGNLFLRAKGGSRAAWRGRAKWIITAHMDHPGFVVRGAKGKMVEADFIGGVGREYFAGARVRLHCGGGVVAAKVEDVRNITGRPFLVCRLGLAREAAVPAGTIGTWDVGPVRVRGGKLSACGCDDVAGAAAVLYAMTELIEAGVGGSAVGMLTRAEEAGFVGALQACSDGSVPAGNVLSIETSARQPTAPLGGGVIVRVGDRASTFDPLLTAHLSAVAGDLARRDANFRFSRQLMPGGTCESTAFSAYGYPAAAVCIALGNYHNQGPRGKIAAERIDLGDFDSLVKLLVAVATSDRQPRRNAVDLRARLKALLRTGRKFL